MSTSYDMIVIGGGHNGLVCAAYMAEAGKSVLVLERLAKLGGTATTDEFAPGFSCSSCFSGVDGFDLGIAHHLRLEKHGLEFLPRRGGVFVPEIEGPGLFLAPAAGADSSSSEASDREVVEQLAEQAGADAEALVDFEVFIRKLYATLEPVLAAPLPEIDSARTRDRLALLGLGLKLRRLGHDDVPEALRFLLMSAADVLEERFNSESVRAALAAPAVSAAWLGPMSAGSAFGLLYHSRGWPAGAFAPPLFVRGGSGALAAALARAAEALGVDLRVEAPATRILTEGKRAVGVVIGSGEEIRARAVVSNVDPRRTLLELVDPLALEPDLLVAASNIRARGSVAIVSYALDALPEFLDAPDGELHLAGRVQVGATVEHLERAFDDAKHHRFPERPYLQVTFPSVSDPTLAPDGKHVAHVWVQYVAAESVAQSALEAEAGASAEDRLGEVVTSTIERYAPGFTDRIIGSRVLTPQALEQRFGMTGGCLHHVEMALDQLLYGRPLAGWSQYRMPVDGLYLCGSGAHPGGGLTGLPGRSCAQQMLRN